MNAAFATLNQMLAEFRGSRPQLREHVGSDRRSPSAGPSDIVRPNPIAQVSDSALQGPDSAPGPSTATRVPPSLGPSRHDAPSSDEYPYPRGRMDEWERVRYGSRHVSSPDRLRDELERTHTEIVETKDYINFCRARDRAPPDHSYRDLDILQSRYDQLSLTLSEWQAFSSSRRGLSAVIASSRAPSPSYAPRPPRPDSSSLRGPCLSPQPGPSSQDRRRPRDASSDLPRHSRLPEERFHDRVAFHTDYSDRRRRRSRESPSPWPVGVASRGSPSPMRIPFAFKGVPFTIRNGSRLKGVPLFRANGSRLKEVPFP